jgi:hypothetical protein
MVKHLLIKKKLSKVNKILKKIFPIMSNLKKKYKKRIKMMIKKNFINNGAKAFNRIYKRSKTRRN